MGIPTEDPAALQRQGSRTLQRNSQEIVKPKEGASQEEFSAVEPTEEDKRGVKMQQLQVGAISHTGTGGLVLRLPYSCLPASLLQ